MKIEFWKYHGTGNDFVMLDGRATNYKSLSSEKIRRLCTRHFGIGADGLIILENSEEAGIDFVMKYYNSDGNLSSMCGNGGRCLTRFAADRGIIKERYSFMAIDGIHESFIDKEKVHLKMGEISAIEQISNNQYFINTGSPHFVSFESLPTGSITDPARAIRNSHRFKEEGVNVNFVDIQEGKLLMRTYERGVEDETLSCGTGVTAAALVAHHANLISTNLIPVSTAGGALELQYSVNDGTYSDVWLIGPATAVFSGEMDI